MDKKREILEKLIQAGKEAEQELRRYERPFSIGNRFRSPTKISKNEFMLIGLGNSKVRMISLTDGTSIGCEIKVMASGGISREEFAKIVNIEHFFKLFLEEKGQKKEWALNKIYGFENYKEDHHYFGYDKETLTKYLAEAGFVKIGQIDSKEDEEQYLAMQAYKE